MKTNSHPPSVPPWPSGRMTRPKRNYSIGDVFPDHEADSIHIRAMHRLVALSRLKPGIPRGNPLKEAD